MASKIQDVRCHQQFGNYQRALFQFNKADTLFEQRGLSDLEKEGLIYGSEFTHGLAWKIM